MPVSILTLMCALLLGACCTSTPNVAAPATAEPIRFIDRQVLAILPSTTAIEFVLNGGERAGIAVGDRAYMRCVNVELKITQVFEFRSRTRMVRPDPWPEIGPVRVYLHGADPKPWCPDPEPAPR